MSVIKTIIFSLLIFQSISLTEDDNTLYLKDADKCSQPNTLGQITTEVCTEITPTLESTGVNKGECCRVNYINDILLSYKKAYGENWKTTICQMFGFDTNISEDELRNKLGMNSSQNTCTLLTIQSKNIELYSLSLSAVGGEVNYDCGDGEKTFNAKTFVPSNDIEKMSKDIADCGFELDEKGCSKRADKLITNDIQCCWCENINLNFNNYKTEMCNGYPTDNLAEKLEATVEINQKNGMNIIMNCSCLNKNGKKTNISLNSSNGEIIVE